MKDLGDVEYAMQLRYDEREAAAEEDHQSLMDELKNKVITKVNTFGGRWAAYLRATTGEHKDFPFLSLCPCSTLKTHTLSAHNVRDMLDELWQEFQKETKQYKDSTEERKLRFEALKKKDDESARTIARQMRKLQKLQDTISVLRQRMASNAKESEMKTKAVKEVYMLL